YPPYTGTLVLNDPLNDPARETAASNPWQSGTNCYFTIGGYVDSESKSGYFSDCLAGSAKYGNFVFQIQMTILSGDCVGGRAALTGEKRGRRACKNMRSPASCIYATRRQRADERVTPILPEWGVFGKRSNRARQHHDSWAPTPALPVSYLRANVQRTARNDV